MEQAQMTVSKNGKPKGLTKENPQKAALSEVTLKDLKDYQKDMDEANMKMKLLDKDMQEQEKTKRGRDWRGGYLMAMVILNANNESVRILQKERDDWFLAFQERGNLLENAQEMVNIQTGLSGKGMTRENELKHEHQQEIRKYLEVLTLLKQFPDKLKSMEDSTPEEIVEALKAIKIKT